MAVYAIGDIQGCLDALQRLLEKIRFDPAEDRLWFVGDLVNRGSKSLETLRFIHSIRKSTVVVLGNHDLHLLAVSEGVQTVKRKDTISEILDAPDAAELLRWLRRRRLFYHDKELGYALVHAGLPPQWSIKQAKKYAREVRKVLKGENYLDFLQVMYGNEPSLWDDNLQGMERIRFIVNAFTRLRYSSRDGRMDFDCKQAPGSQPWDLLPWYEIPDRLSRNDRIVFGHWSTLQEIEKNNTICIDTGCVWGGHLTGVRLDKQGPTPIAVACPGNQRPG